MACSCSEIFLLAKLYAWVSAMSKNKSLVSCNAVAAVLAPRLKGFDITTDLMQVGKVVTGQHLDHHGQGLRATLIVLEN